MITVSGASRRSFKTAMAIGVVALMATQGAAAAEQGRVELNDGSILIGEVVDFRDDQITLKTAYADAIQIKSALIASLTSEAAVELLLDDNSVVEVEQLAVKGGEVALANGKMIALSNVAIANPADWEKGEGYRWEGNSGAGVAYNRGNTETDELNLSLNTTLTSVRDRITLRSRIEQDDTFNRVTTVGADGSETVETRKIATADNWSVVGKYDYFLEDPDHYFGVNASASADALANIDLRTYIGPYYGRKILRESWLTLDGELGLAYVDTDFAVVDDTEYVGVNWNFTGESDILGGDSRLYLTHVGIVNSDDVGRSIFNTTVGLAFPLVMGLEGATEISLDYDGGAAEGNENLDQTYSFRIGYSW